VLILSLCVDSTIAAGISPDKTTKVPVIKLSNHGSVVSAPTDLTDHLKPSHFICSVGPSLEQLHPRWELLVYLKALADSDGRNEPFFHPTNYPVYFVAPNPSKTDPPKPTDPLKFEFQPFEENVTDEDVTRFQNAVKALDETLFLKIQERLKENLDKASITRWAADFLRNCWPHISFSTPEQHPIIGAVGNNLTVSQQTQILFIAARLSTSDPIISYVNGARKTVSKSGDFKPKPDELLSRCISYLYGKTTFLRRSVSIDITCLAIDPRWSRIFLYLVLLTVGMSLD
jgi:hypothetical protein